MKITTFDPNRDLIIIPGRVWGLACEPIELRLVLDTGAGYQIAMSEAMYTAPGVAEYLTAEGITLEDLEYTSKALPAPGASAPLVRVPRVRRGSPKT